MAGKINSPQHFMISALSATITAVLAGGGNVAIAQEEAGALEEITVTGSRIQRSTGFTTPVPLTAVTPDELTNFEPGNLTAEQLDSLPQFFETHTAQRGHLNRSVVGTGGAGLLNMRNLGTSRTLILLDGARLVPQGGGGGTNVDVIPTALMSSVDVVTGGASAAYGADAVGGAVNFVLNREFEGLNVSTGVGAHEHKGTGQQWNLSIAGGQSFVDQRLHLIGSFEAREIDYVRGDRRRYSNFRRTGNVFNPDPNGPARIRTDYVFPTTTSPTGLIQGTGTELDGMQFTIDGTGLEPFDPSCATIIAASNAGGNPDCPAYQRFDDAAAEPGNGQEVTNRSGFLAAQWRFSDTLSAYVQGMYGRTTSGGPGEGVYYFAQNQWIPRLFPENPFLPDEVRQVMLDNDMEFLEINKAGMMSHAEYEVGSTTRPDNRHTQTQYSAGFNWDISQRWNLRGSWQTGDYEGNQHERNLTQIDRQYLATDAVRHPETGEIVCNVQLYNPSLEELAAAPSIQGLNSSRPLNPFEPTGIPGNTQPLPYPVEPAAIPSCVPLTFLGSGNASREAVEYIGTGTTNRFVVDQDFAELMATGELATLPAGTMSGAFGLTWREQSFLQGKVPVEIDLLGGAINTPELGIRGVSPGWAGGAGSLHFFSGVPHVGGEYNVWEWFSEVDVPVWENNSRLLSLGGAFRRSYYDNGNTGDSWKLGVNFQVHEDLRLRYTNSRDVREPTFNERFARSGFGAGVEDPELDLNYLISGVAGGNPDVNAETAETVTAGFVYQPSFAPWVDGLQLSVDFWDVEIRGAINSVSVQRIIDDCFAGAQAMCANIQRDPETRFITQVNSGVQNLGRETVKGTDMEIVYRAEPNFFGNQSEAFQLRFLGGYIKEAGDIPDGGIFQDVSGTLGFPDFTGVVTANYDVGSYSFRLQGTYTGSVTFNGNWIEGIDVDNNSVSSETIISAQLGYNGTFINGAAWNARLNITNLLNTEAPIMALDSRGYERFGRRYNMSFNYSF
jgi:outer membrane receptor protein involved in Fe transport